MAYALACMVFFNTTMRCVRPEHVGNCSTRPRTSKPRTPNRVEPVAPVPSHSHVAAFIACRAMDATTSASRSPASHSLTSRSLASRSVAPPSPILCLAAAPLPRHRRRVALPRSPSVGPLCALRRHRLHELYTRPRFHHRASRARHRVGLHRCPAVLPHEWTQQARAGAWLCRARMCLAMLCPSFKRNV
jgi:hypothetical protein